MNFKARIFAPRDWSIRLKLTLMAMGTTAMALLLTVAGIAVFEYITLRNGLRDEQQMLSEIIGGNSTAAVTFNRADDATSTLATLSANADIRAACIYDADGKLMAKYVAPGEVNISFAEHPGPKGHVIKSSVMETYEPIMLDGKAIGMIYMRSDFRDMYQRLRLYAWISPIILVAASCIGLLIISRLQRSVSAPVVALAETSRRISEENDYSLRAQKYGNDELGQLADAFNHMLDGIRQRDQQIQNHLKEVKSARDLFETRVEERTWDLKRANSELKDEMLHRQEAERKREQMQANLVEASRKAGMADVATGVLHNVGNVLNSVNVSAQIVQDAVKTSRITTLVKAADLLREHAADMNVFLTSDERGKTLPVFFMKLADALGAERTKLLLELDGLSSSVGHIREIVAMQQSLARVSGVMTMVTVGEMIEDALKINQAGLKRHQVSIIRDFDADLRITTDRHKVLQILINLISNAKYAVDNVAEGRQITICVRTIENDRFFVSVTDNGTGIDPQNLTRIFSYGFTTKKNGHGFGLHSAALAAKELGGMVEVSSDGLGKGATFKLTLPLCTEVLAHAS